MVVVVEKRNRANIKKMQKDNISARLKNFEFAKKFGQNFIFDEDLLASIVEDSEISQSSSVLEIGAGAGTLTRFIAAAAKKVVAFEIDTRLEPILKENLKSFSNVELVFSDVLSTTLADVESHFEKNYSIVANLPYYITTPIIFFFLNSTRMDSMTIMVQKEVATRLTSGCGSSDYGILSVLVQAKCSAEITQIVNRDKFTPPPNVDSAVVLLKRNNNYIIENEKAFENTVKLAFAMKRKTLVNNLCQGLKISRENAIELLLKLNYPPTTRAEQLTISDFISLSKLITF